MDSDVRFEAKEVFHAGCSKFNLRSKTFTKKEDPFPYGGKGGVPLSWRNEDKTVFVDTTDTHTMIIGATGSKKSRLLVMPMVKILGYAEESMIITDPKAEIYERTATELINSGYDIAVVNLRDPQLGNNWNPLKIPYDFYCAGNLDKANEFANDIALNLMMSELSHKEAYWDSTAKDLFFGLILLLFRICKENNWPNAVNIGNVIMMKRVLFVENEISNYSSYMQQQIGEYIDADEIVKASLSSTIGNAENTRRNILCQFDYHMSTFVLSNTLTQMLSKNTIDFDNIGKKKSAVFLIMPDEKTTYHKLVSLFVKQSYEYLIYKAQDMEYRTMPVRINYVLDEFSSLPKIKDFSSMVSAARSRNIRFNLVMQSKSQLESRYADEAETIQANCMNWVFLTSRELQLLKNISEQCGIRIGGNKPLISISDLQQFDKEKGEVLVMSQRRKPFKTNLVDIDEYDGKKFTLPKYPQGLPAHSDDDNINLKKKILELMEGSRQSFKPDTNPFETQPNTDIKPADPPMSNASTRPKRNPIFNYDGET